MINIPVQSGSRMTTDPVRRAKIHPDDVFPVGLWAGQVVLRISCPWCLEFHTHRWRASDVAPGAKNPPCRRRARYWVPAPPAPSRGKLVDAIDRARAALDAVEADANSTDTRRPPDVLYVVLLAAALTGAVDRALERTR